MSFGAQRLCRLISHLHAHTRCPNTQKSLGILLPFHTALYVEAYTIGELDKLKMGEYRRRRSVVMERQTFQDWKQFYGPHGLSRVVFERCSHQGGFGTRANKGKIQDVVNSWLMQKEKPNV